MLARQEALKLYVIYFDKQVGLCYDTGPCPLAEQATETKYARTL